MKLHHDVNLFSATLRAASDYLDINLEFVEKDYWITLALHRLSRSNFVNESAFKGGTSLSKGYNIIERFSEDLDIAVINNNNKSGNEIKTTIRAIEKEITPDFSELKIDGITSKGSRFRKSVFEYTATEKVNTNNRLIIEINSFANPFPFQKLVIRSMIFDFLIQIKNEAFVELYDLQSFEINVLNKEQTLLEKLVSLIRFSLNENSIESISGKIRHFYDLYYLMQDPECIKFVASDSFKIQFDVILNHDREIFEEPTGWQTKPISNSILITDFPTAWGQLKDKYQTELSALAYRPIPSEKNVALCFKHLSERIL